MTIASKKGLHSFLISLVLAIGLILVSGELARTFAQGADDVKALRF